MFGVLMLYITFVAASRHGRFFNDSNNKDPNFLVNRI